jgi:outer membrane protein TolC
VNVGVDDNLPLVTAQATLAGAENNLVESLYQYNVSKLALARASGVLELQYRDYLGR